MSLQVGDMFGTRPKATDTPPLTVNDHLELDTTVLLGDCATEQYQTLIGDLQWITALGRSDTATATITMSRFCVSAEGTTRAAPVNPRLPLQNEAWLCLPPYSTTGLRSTGTNMIRHAPCMET